MIPYRLEFESPTLLWLMMGLPVLWWIGWGSLRSIGPVRRILATLFRSTVWIAIVFALAGVQWVRVSDRMTVMYVLDQSESIPRAKRDAMLQFVIKNVRQHRDVRREDRAGIVVFGRDASIEIPPFDDNIPPLRRVESLRGRVDATNLETALNLAQASMPEDTARRLVIVTDGNENIGEAKRLAARLGSAGIGIDVVPVQLSGGSEILVEKVDLPGDIRKGQPFEARVVVNHDVEESTDQAEPVEGTLRLKQRVAGEESLLLEQAVRLQPGKNVFPVRHQIDTPAAYTYEAEFVPGRDRDDAIDQNNRATAYTYVRGKGRVLLIEQAGRGDRHAALVNVLRDADIEVVTQPLDSLFGSLAELQAYDAVILADVPRVGESAEEGLTSFSDLQVEMLVSNTRSLGAGLLMIGGPESFGAGGWTGTKLEEAMPVDFKIRNTKVQTTGALALIMHAGEMAEGNFWQKEVAKLSIRQLGPQDFAGLLHWTMRGDEWLWGGTRGMLKVGPHRRAMLDAVGRMTPGDMPEFDPAMRIAAAGLARINAATKHLIIISDGDPTAPSGSTIRAFKDNKITISTVAVASHGLTGSRRLEEIARVTGGKYYSVTSGRALPKIYQREARRISKPLIFEPEGGVAPQVVFPHPSLDGLPDVFPRASGFMLTQTKDSPLAQVLVRSPKPPNPENATVVAVWTYGLGRTAVVTTDSGENWAAGWVGWDGYEKFYSQLVRWLMRPSGDTGKLTLSTQVREGKVEVVIGALDADDGFLNFLQPVGTAVDPNMNEIDVPIRQVAPGRYVGTFPADGAGSYFVTVVPGEGKAPLMTGVTVPYSDEYRVRTTGVDLITSLASTDPRGGEVGEVAPPLGNSVSDDLIALNAFRGGVAPARSIRDAWPWFVLAACSIFLADVFVRRVAVGLGWMTALRKRVGGENAVASATISRLDTLRQSKQNTHASSGGGIRFDPTAASPSEEDGASFGDDDGGGGGGGSNKPPTSPKPAPLAGEEKSYTERLLEAKRRAKK